MVVRRKPSVPGCLRTKGEPTVKRRMITWFVVVLVLALGVTTVLAKGQKKRALVKFDYTDETGTEYYCEGEFLKTGSGIVHEWRDNPECINWGMPVTSFHLVFKPMAKFQEDEGGGENLLGCYPGPWLLTDAYVDLDDDEADLTDYYGEPYEQGYWACVYEWKQD